MSQVKVEFSGGVVAEPTHRSVGQSDLLEFPVYVNHSKKDKDSGEYVPTGDVTKIRVTLWRELADTDIQKGDIVEVKGTLIEKEYDKQDGTKGRSLQTDFVDSVVVKWRKNAEAEPAGF
jgi:single-stranded DNA-binding protein